MRVRSIWTKCSRLQGDARNPAPIVPSKESGVVNTERERGQSVERLLRQSLGADATSAAPGSCLDAATLATWLDGGLTPSELTTAEAHVSECSRCQTMLAA